MHAIFHLLNYHHCNNKHNLKVCWVTVVQNAILHTALRSELLHVRTPTLYISKVYMKAYLWFFSIASSCFTPFTCAAIMKTSVVFFVILVGCYLVVADDPASNEGEVPPTNIDNSNVSAADIPSHVNEFINSNPQIVSGAVPPTPSPDGSIATKCECAVFNTEAPTELDSPILTQAPMTVSCDFAGEENCIKLCSALAEAARESGPQLLCSTLGHYNKLKASVHSRICGAKTWTYTGLTSPTEICCHDHQVIECKDQVETPPENIL